MVDPRIFFGTGRDRPQVARAPEARQEQAVSDPFRLYGSLLLAEDCPQRRPGAGGRFGVGIARNVADLARPQPFVRTGWGREDLDDR